MQRNYRYSAASTALTVSVFMAMTAAGAAPAEGDALDAPVGLSDVLGLGVSLIVVLGAVVLVGWLYARSQGVRGAGSSVIQILAAQPLGPKERIVLVEIGGKQIVVGMTAAQVQTLHVFDEPVVADTDAVAVGTAFADRLRSALRGVGR